MDSQDEMRSCLFRDMDAEEAKVPEDPIGLFGFSSASRQGASTAKPSWTWQRLNLEAGNGWEWCKGLGTTQTCFDTGMADAGLEVHREHDRARASDLSEKVRTLLS